MRPWPKPSLVIDRKQPGWRNALHTRIYKPLVLYWLGQNLPEHEAKERASIRTADLLQKIAESDDYPEIG